MQQLATAEPSSNFAGVLAAFVTPGKKRPPARDLEGLEDDVVELSYERALRAHSRFRARDFGDRSLTQVSHQLPLRIMEVFPADVEPAAEPAPKPAAVLTIMEAQPEPACEPPAAPARKPKSARITMSLSIAEHEQLRARATEAGLTLSAYLRSCTIEAESLRALVKDTLAQLRHESAPDRKHDTPAARGSWFGWLRWPWPRAHPKQQAARA
jgi:hypothetical protein